MSKSWLIGFIEAEGSFYLTNKTKDRIVHGFGLTQKLDPIVLYTINYILNINSKVRYRSQHDYYIVDTTSKETINKIISYFITKDHTILFLGVKNLEFSIWKRSFIKYKSSRKDDIDTKLYKYNKLKDTLILLRKIRKFRDNSNTSNPFRGWKETPRLWRGYY
jgi:hypothetical protein